MTRALVSDRVPPASGEVRAAVVFLHGYGANGADLLGLAEPMAPHMPDTLFIAPDAPEACIAAPFGLQWFPIPWIDGSSEETAEAGLLAAAADLDAFLDGLMAEEDLLPEQVALFGFSQGAMMALHVAPRREDGVAAIVACSGRLLRPDLLADEARARPPVLLIHGAGEPAGWALIAGATYKEKRFLARMGIELIRPAAGGRGAAARGLAGGLRPCDEGDRPRHRARRARRRARLPAVALRDGLTGGSSPVPASA